MRLQRFTDQVDVYEVDVYNQIKQIERIPLPYIGHKRKLLRSIYQCILKNNTSFNSVLDAFSGSASVSMLFKAMGKRVISNDILTSAYINSVVLVEDHDIFVDSDDESVLFNSNGNATTFVRDHYRSDGKIGRYNKFTVQECIDLDNFRNNVNLLGSYYAQCISMMANATVIMRLPFGNVDASTDPLSHRIKQQKTYGKGSKLHDRRIGIYYDDNYNLRFRKWFQKYSRDFTLGNKQRSSLFNGEADLITNINKNRCNISNIQSCATNMNVIDILGEKPQVDCIYFDPPYGGQASDYLSTYRFLEEYIYQQPMECIQHLLCGRHFTAQKQYKKYFSQMLDIANYVPIWIFSYNDSSWSGIHNICNIIQKFNRRITVNTLDNKYKYKYRNKIAQTGTEYMITAILR